MLFGKKQRMQGQPNKRLIWSANSCNFPLQQSGTYNYVHIYFRTPSRAVLWVRKYIVPDSPVGELCGSYNKLHFGTYVLSELRMVDVSVFYCEDDFPRTRELAYNPYSSFRDKEVKNLIISS